MKQKFAPRKVTIRTLHPDGYGLTDDPKFCVLDVLPNETVIARPFIKKKRKLFAKPDQIITASDSRVSPICNAAARCGGCSLQHLDTGKQIVKKQQFLRDVLAETLPDNFYSPMVGPTANYRSKARIGVRYVEKKGRIMVGFREKMKPYIVAMDTCPVLKTPVSNLLPELAALIEALSVYRAIPQIELAMGDADIALVFRHLEEIPPDDHITLQSFGAAHGIAIYLQPGSASSVHKIYPAKGCDRLTYRLPAFGLTYKFHPMDFTQINQSINRLMVRRAIELLDLQENDRVFDAFCGIGNFSLAISRSVRQVYAVEVSETCVTRGIENAQLNNIQNCLFKIANLFQADIACLQLNNINKVLLDPPRNGALEVCKRLASHRVERIVYVSCNPITLARDAQILVAAGYNFDGAGIIDMFPHTAHVESIACFSTC